MRRTGPLTLQTVVASLVAPAPAEASPAGRCADSAALSVAGCERCLSLAGASPEKRRGAAARLAQLARARSTRKQALEALARLAFDVDAGVRRKVLAALVAGGQLRRATIRDVPTASALLKKIRKALLVTPKQKKAARSQLINAPDCTPLGAPRKVRGYKRRRAHPVACSAGVLKSIKADHCALQRSLGRAARVSCQTTLCGGACQVYRLLTKVLAGRRWRVSALLIPRADRGECGHCM